VMTRNECQRLLQHLRESPNKEEHEAGKSGARGAGNQFHAGGECSGQHEEGVSEVNPEICRVHGMRVSRDTSFERFGGRKKVIEKDQAKRSEYRHERTNGRCSEESAREAHQ